MHNGKAVRLLAEGWLNPPLVRCCGALPRPTLLNPLQLFRFFVNRVLVAVGTELFQLHPSSGIATVLRRGVPRHTGRSLIRVGATLGAL
jgi:hypothetical protein